MVWKQGWGLAFFFSFLGVKICTIVKLLIDYSHKYNDFFEENCKKKISKISKNLKIIRLLYTVESR